MGKREKIYRIIIALLLICILLTQTPVSLQAAVKCKSVKMNVTKGTIGVGEVLTLNTITTPLNATGKQVWSSSNKKVATVTQYGAVTGVGIGSATITVKVNGKKATCRVTVTKYATKEEIGEKLENYYTKDEIDKIIDDKTRVNNFTNTSVNDSEQNYNNIDYPNKTLIYSDNNIDLYFSEIDTNENKGDMAVIFTAKNKTSYTRNIGFYALNVNGVNSDIDYTETVFSGLTGDFHSYYYNYKTDKVKSIRGIIMLYSTEETNSITAEFSYNFK